MSYQIVKGWPADSAIDEKFTLADGAAALSGGMVAMVDANGEVEPATYDNLGNNAANLAALIIDNDEVTGELVGLQHPILLEVCPEHYTAGVYAANDPVTATAGLINVVSGSERVIGKVRSIDAATGVMRILLFGQS